MDKGPELADLSLDLRTSNPRLQAQMLSLQWLFSAALYFRPTLRCRGLSQILPFRNAVGEPIWRRNRLSKNLEVEPVGRIPV